MYYELLPDGTIGRFTPCADVAQKLGLDLKTDREIAYGFDGRCYFADELPAAPAEPYHKSRAREYPSVGDQLDMIYHDQCDGTTIWRDTITDIKTKYPKE